MNISVPSSVNKTLTCSVCEKELEDSSVPEGTSVGFIQCVRCVNRGDGATAIGSLISMARRKFGKAYIGQLEKLFKDLTPDAEQERAIYHFIQDIADSDRSS